MDFLLTDTMHDFFRAFSGMLLHSLWQGLLLVLTTYVLLVACSHKTASFKYTLVLVSLLTFILACVFTFYLQWHHRALETLATLRANTTTGVLLAPDTSTNVIPGLFQGVKDYFSANAPVIMLVWFVFFMYRMTFAMGSFLYIHHARYHKVYSPPAYWKQRFNAISQSLKLKKKIILLESGFVKIPMIVGYFRPVVLMPLGLLTGLPPGQVEAVLLHELAHIRRHDYLVNIIQLIAETFFFFNPGLLWLSSQLRVQREYCCDDIALGQTNNKREFVQALINFKSYALRGDAFTMAFPGNKNQLYHRVNRIVNNKKNAFNVVDRTFFFSGIFILLMVGAFTASPETVIPAEARTISIHNLPAGKIISSIRLTPEKKTTGIAAKKQLPKQAVPSLIKENTAPLQANNTTMNVVAGTIDSTILNYLTGEFNTTWKNTKYRIGIAKSKITWLAVNDEEIAPAEWYLYNDAIIEIVLNFKKKQEQLAKEYANADKYTPYKEFTR